MNPPGARLIWIGIVCLVIGALGLVYIPDLFVSVSNAVGEGGRTGLGVVNVVLTVVRSGLLPLGAALIAGGLVVNAVARLVAPMEREGPDPD